jgi:hypothetical protein
MSEFSETPCPEKPRRSTQFKPGQSGNPLGRPKRKLDMSVALNKALNEKIRVSHLGTTRTGLEAVVQSIVDRVLKGDSKGIPERMRLFNKVKLFKPIPNPTRLTGVVVSRPLTGETRSWAFNKAITRSETALDFGYIQLQRRIAMTRQKMQTSKQPDARAAVDGRLPRGIGVERLRDAPAEWSRQFEALGLNPR